MGMADHQSQPFPVLLWEQTLLQGSIWAREGRWIFGGIHMHGGCEGSQQSPCSTFTKLTRQEQGVYPAAASRRAVILVSATGCEWRGVSVGRMEMDGWMDGWIDR